MCQILHDYKVLKAYHLLNKIFGKSGLYSGPDLAFCIKLLLEVVRFKVVRMAFVPLGTLSPVPFILALRLSASSLTVFQSGMGREPSPANTARSLFGVSLTAHRLPLFG